MGYYEEAPPRHGHRTPSELAEDEKLAALRGNVCIPGHIRETGPTGTECVRHSHLAVLPWADAHPIEAARLKRSPHSEATASTSAGTSSRTKQPKESRPTRTTRIPETPSAANATPSAQKGFRQLFHCGNSFKLLLAIENDDNAHAAIRLADALTARGAIPTVVSVAEIMMPAPGTPNSMIFYAEAVLGEDFHYQRRRSLQALIAEATGTDQDWPITSVVGDASAFIIDEAEAQRSGLVVLGIHHHGAFEQAIGENTATRVMGRASVPVLGVRTTFSGLPRKIMVATDFGDASREAAHVAANLADPDGTVILVHVSLPSPVIEEGDEGAALVQREGIEHAFLHLSEEISAGKSVRVETINREGDAAAQLMAAATLISPDLIAIASQRHHLITRMLLGSVTRKLTREGHWAMLVVPPLSERR